MRLLLVGAVLFSASRGANAACVLSGARPTVSLPTMLSGQEFSFIASPDCETLRFTIRGTTVSKVPTSGRPVGPGPNTYKVVLTESEWNDVVAESGSTLTWIVTGTTSAGVMTRMITTNDLKGDEPITIDLSRADAKLVGENRGDLAGFSASVAGDVNGDGKDDLLLGSTSNSEGGYRAGAAYLVLGPVTGTLDLASADAKLLGERPGDHTDRTAGAGDVDGDGNDDLLIGSTRNGHGERSLGPGAAYLVRGPVSGTLDLSLADAKLVGETFDDNHAAGCYVSSAGDQDGDGLADLLVGMCGGIGDPDGIAYLVHGLVTGTFDLGLADAKLTIGHSFSDNTVVSSAGDLDADGFDDLLIGASGDFEADTDAGAAYLVRGPVSGVVDLETGHTKLLGEGFYDAAGSAVAGAGDIDGDGNDDVLIGAFGHDGAATNTGAVYVVLGPGPDPSDPPPSMASVADAILVGTVGGEDAGRMVAGAGDVDLDGYDDILVGATFGSADNVGTAYLVLSPVAGAMELSRADIMFTNGHKLDNTGWAGGAGDVDGDGRPDLLISAPWDNEGGHDAGAAYLVYGGGL